MTEYNKLVRDKIPEIIRSGGEVPNVRILEQEEYLVCLNKKLDEEVAEFHCDQNAEELADILEVLYALTKAIGCNKEELMRVYESKHENRGGFDERIFLISKE